MTWEEFIANESKKDYYIELHKKVEKAYEANECYPPFKNIFHALSLTKIEDVKVVILGQDPYHEPNQAHGLAFSVECDKLPPSLVNIYKEMATDLNRSFSQNGNLEYLAKQGVLLLNTTLTVTRGMANSHSGYGWNIFTDNIIKMLNEIDRPIVFILWGNPSIRKKELLNNPKHLILTSAHPSPLSAYRGFFGSRPFSKANEFLRKNNLKEIKWIKEDYLND